MNIINLIAIDTVSDDLKIAVNIGEKEFFINKKNNSSQNVESLIPLIDSTFKELNVSPNVITHVAVCVGPGSFTGIRVGLATAFGLVFGKNIDIVGFSQFDIYNSISKNKLDHKDKIDYIIIPIIDAKKDSVYTCFISKNINDDENYLAGECLAINELSNKLNDIVNDIDRKIYFVGKDFLPLRDRIINNKNINYEYCYTDNYSSEDMFYVMRKRIIKGKRGIVEPLYLRKSDAELSLFGK